MGNMKRILCSDRLLEQARWTHFARSGLPALIPRKRVERTYRVRNFWTMSATKSQKATEDSQNKENINDLRGFNVLQILLDFFPGSQNKQVILDSY